MKLLVSVVAVIAWIVLFPFVALITIVYGKDWIHGGN